MCDRVTWLVISENAAELKTFQIPLSSALSPSVSPQGIIPVPQWCTPIPHSYRLYILFTYAGCAEWSWKISIVCHFGATESLAFFLFQE